MYYNRHRLIFTGAGGYDSDAEAYFTVAGITDTDEKNAWNTFVTTGKANGIYSKLPYFYPFLGLTSTTQSWNAIDPIVGSQVVWYTTNTHDSNGFTTNTTLGGSGYITVSSGVSATSQGFGGRIVGLDSYNPNDFFGIVLEAQGNNGNYTLYSGGTSLNQYYTQLWTNSDTFDMGQLGSVSHVSYQMLSSGGDDNTLYEDGVYSASSDIFENSTIGNLFFGDGDTILNPLTFHCVYVSQGLTSSEMTTLDTMINTLMTALGR